MKNIRNLSFCLFAVASLGLAQTVTTSTTLSAALGRTDTSITLASGTGVIASSLSPQSGAYIDREYVTFVANLDLTGTTSTRWSIKRSVGGLQSVHLSGATVWIGPTGAQGPFDQGPNDRVGSCLSVTLPYTPMIEVRSGTLIACNANNKYTPMGVSSFFVPPQACTGVPTTLTQTSTWPVIGTIGIPVLKTISNAAAGTLTVTCTFAIPTSVAVQRGAMVQDITMFLASSATGSGVVPTSMGVPTLGTLTFPAAALTQTASSNTATAIGGTGTLTGGGVTATSGFMTAVTTDGTFYTIKATFASAVDLSTDLRVLQFAQPVLQSAASVTTLYTPGLLVHYYAPLLF